MKQINLEDYQIERLKKVINQRIKINKYVLGNTKRLMFVETSPEEIARIKEDDAKRLKSVKECEEILALL